LSAISFLMDGGQGALCAGATAPERQWFGLDPEGCCGGAGPAGTENRLSVFMLPGESLEKRIRDSGVKVIARPGGLAGAIIGRQMLIHGAGGAATDCSTD